MTRHVVLPMGATLEGNLAGTGGARPILHFG